MLGCQENCFIVVPALIRQLHVMLIIPIDDRGQHKEVLEYHQFLQEYKKDFL